MIHANHAGTSWPKPEPVRAAVAEALDAPPETWPERLEAGHGAVCRALGIDDPSRLLLTTGATSALAVAVSDHAWEPGDRVLVSGLEHHALHRPALQLAGRGVEVGVVPRSAAEPVVLDALEAELRRGRVRMVAMVAACNVTGELTPVDEIGALAREHGALFLLDAAQTAGWMPLWTGSPGPDLAVFAGHKGPQGPWGIGGLYVAPHVRMRSPRASCEVGTEAGGACAPMPGYCDVGSVNHAALAGLVAGLEWLAKPEREDRLACARARVGRVASAVAGLPGMTFHGSADAEARMPTLALSVDGRTPAQLASGLAARGVLASGGLQCAPLAHETLGTAPDGVLRVSFGPTNSDADAETVAEALRECVTAGAA